jgi:hypothetical protein
MVNQPATVTLHFPDLKPTLQDFKEKVQQVLDSQEFAKKLQAEFPKDATPRGNYEVKTITLTGTGTGTDAAGKGGGGGTVSVGITWGKK